MLEDDSCASSEIETTSGLVPQRRARRCRDAAPNLHKPIEIQPFPRWANVGGVQHDAASAHFFAGAALARLDYVLRGSGADVSSAGKNYRETGGEPCFAGVLRQRLALRAGAACGTLARLREDDAALRDAEHLAGLDAAPTPGARLHRLWRLFASRRVRLDARLLRVAADHLDLPPDIDGDALITIAHETRDDAPLVAASRVSVETLRVLDNASPIDAEIFALWFADLVLAQHLRWDAPLPLLATTIAHPALRTASHRRPRPSDPDWSLSVARSYARAAQEAYALTGELSRRSETLLRAAPKLRAKGATRVIEMLLDDDCIAPARAAKAARLSDRAARRLFDRLIALGAVRELSGRTNFRLYGL